jgi:hypothetical protein
MTDESRRLAVPDTSKPASAYIWQGVRALATTLAWGPAVYATREFLRAYWAPDTCLDVDHGSFDYRNWRCSQEQQDYIGTALQDVPGFWAAVFTVIAAVGLTVLIRRYADANSARL